MKSIVINLRVRYGSKRYVKVMAMADYLGIDPTTKMFDKMLDKIEDMRVYDLELKQKEVDLERQMIEIKNKRIT